MSPTRGGWIVLGALARVIVLATRPCFELDRDSDREPPRVSFER